MSAEIPIILDLEASGFGCNSYPIEIGSELHCLLDGAHRRPRFRLEALQILFTEQYFEIWDTIKNRIFSEVNIPRHRASNDARVLQQTYLEAQLQTQ